MKTKKNKNEKNVRTLGNGMKGLGLGVWTGLTCSRVRFFWRLSLKDLKSRLPEKRAPKKSHFWRLRYFVTYLLISIFGQTQLSSIMYLSSFAIYEIHLQLFQIRVSVDPDAAAGSLDEVGPGRADMSPLDPTWSNLIQRPRQMSASPHSERPRVYDRGDPLVPLKAISWVASLRLASTKAEDSARFRSPEGS